MNKILKTYRESCYRNFSNGQLEKELLFLDAIEHPEHSYVKFASVNKELIYELANKALSGEIDRYELYNNASKYFPKIKFQQKEVLQGLVFYRAGEMKKKQDLIQLNDLGMFWEKFDADFFIAYAPSEKQLDDYVETADWDFYIENTRDLERNNAALLASVKEIYANATNDDSIINRIYQFNDGGYLRLPNDVEALVWMIKMQQRWDLFVKVLDYLEFFPYQGSLIYDLRSLEECSAIITHLHECNHEEILQYLVRKRIVQLINDEENILKSNAEGLHKRWSEYASELYARWLQTKNNVLISMTEVWLKVFGAEKLSVWISGELRHSLGVSENIRTNELQVLNLMNKFVLERLDFSVIDFSKMDIATLFNYATYVRDKRIDENTSLSIFNEIVSQMYNTSYCPEWQLNEKGFEIARAVYQLIPPNKNDVIKLLKTKHKPIEGYKVSMEKNFESALGESFILSTLLLQIEQSADTARFRELVILLNRYSWSVYSSQEDLYFIPYYIAELIVLQVLKEEKDSYEKDLIMNYPQLSFVLRVLSANGGNMSDNVKELLMKRIEEEWKWEKKLMIQRKNEMYKVLDKYIADVKRNFQS